MKSTVMGEYYVRIPGIQVEGDQGVCKGREEGG